MEVALSCQLPPRPAPTNMNQPFKKINVKNKKVKVE